MKLEEGMYVRTKWGYIYELVNINDFGDEDIQKASHNIIDLIEVGDYVNGYYVEDIRETYVNIATGSNYFQKPSIDEDDIKSIVTHEQFESMAYRVGE